MLLIIPSLLPDFREKVTYDGNGNILTYLRRGNAPFAGKPLAMDSLVYSYLPLNNRLDHVHDHVAATNYGNDLDAQRAADLVYPRCGRKCIEHLFERRKWSK